MDQTAAEISAESNDISLDNRLRARIIFAVSTILFFIAMAIPWYFIYRHSGSFIPKIEDLGKSLQAPWSVFIQGKAVSPNLLKISILLYAGMLIIAGRLLDKNRKIIQWIITVLLILLAAGSFRIESYNQTKKLLAGDFIQYWNSYHYYFGSKYFDELGYFYHYSYTFKAAEEGALEIDHVKIANDLFEYKPRKRKKVLDRVAGRKDFTEERWEMFKKELGYFDRFVPKRSWRGMMGDHGCNGTPFGLTTGGVLADLFPITNRGARTFLFSLDQILMLLAFCFIAWAFGLRWAAVLALFFFTMFVNLRFTVGGFVRYDFYSATLISFALFKKGFFKTSAPFLAYASMVRIFPAFLMLGPGIKWLFDWVRTRQMNRKLFSSFVVFVFCCVLFFGVGMLNDRGFSGWKQFFKNITHHTAHQHIGPLRVGHKHIFTHDLTADKMSRGGRRKNFIDQVPIYRATQILMLTLFVLAVLRRNPNDAYLLGFMFIFFIVVLSRYYWSLAGLLFLLSQEDRSRWRNVYSDILLIFLVVNFYAFQLHEREIYSIYMSASFSLFGYFFFLAGSFLAEDAFALSDYLKKRRQKTKGPRRISESTLSEAN